MQLKHLVTALSFLFAGHAFAADPVPAKPAPKRPAAAAVTTEDVIGRTVYQALIGEFALRAGDLDLAASAWGDLAVRTRDPQVMARAIEVLAVARKFDNALEIANLWLQVEPDSAKAAEVRSALMLQSNRLEDLAPQIAAVLAKDGATLPTNLLQLNRLLARHADKKAVQKLVDRLASPYDNLPEAHFAMSQAATQAGDFLRALSEAEKALILRPDWEPAALIRAQLQARQSSATAIDGLSGFLRRYPEARDARLTLARLLVTEKRYDESQVHFDRLLKDAPDNPEVIYPLAMLALQQGDLTKGRGLLERLLKTGFVDKSTVYFFLGQIEEESQQGAQALAHYLQVVSGEQYISARIRIALIQQKQGQVEDARETIRSSLASTPAERTQLILAESQLLREVGRLEEAYAVLEKALVKEADNTEVRYEAALLAERMGQPEVLEKHLKRVLALKPDHAHALNALGYSLAERNIRLDEAEKLVNQALQAAPGDPFIMDSLGWVQFRQGRTTEALQTLQQAYALKNDGEIAAHIAEVLWAMTRREEAKLWLQESLKRHPENEALRGVAKKLLP